MGTAACSRRGPGRSVSLLLLLLLSPLAAPGLWGSLPAATPSLALGGTLEGSAPAPRAQRLVPGAPGCRQPKVTGRIYGGRDAAAGQWPWQASLRLRGSHICGAVLLDSQWLVSAAHCFLNKSRAPEDYQVLLGSTQLHRFTPHARKVALSRIITHPDFEKPHPFGNDIAMLQLHLPVNFTSYISPACLPPPGLRLTNHTSCWIAGWGMLSEDAHLLPPFQLQEARVGLVQNWLCNTLYAQRLGRGAASVVHEDMLCAGDVLTGKAVCQGDSGGPLVCDLLGSRVLLGLASWGLDCRPPIYPSVFTSVVHFTDWIDSTRRSTPPPDPSTTPPQTQAAGSQGPGPARLLPHTWIPLLSGLRAGGQALQ